MASGCGVSDQGEVYGYCMEKYEVQWSRYENIRKLNDKQVDFSEVVQEKWLEKEVELNKMHKIM